MLQNIDPKKWGKYYWKMLEYICFSYPDNPSQEDKQNIIIFFNSLSNVLPCQKCRNHFKLNLQKYPLDVNTVLNNKHNLLTWLLTIHNEVNISLGKKVITFDEMINNINNPNLTTLSNFYDIRLFIIILLIILILILILYVRK
jgi:hypothetical protein